MKERLMDFFFFLSKILNSVHLRYYTFQIVNVASETRTKGDSSLYVCTPLIITLISNSYKDTSYSSYLSYIIKDNSWVTVTEFAYLPAGGLNIVLGESPTGRRN